MLSKLLYLLGPQEKDQKDAVPLDSQRGDLIPLDPLKKEKPCGNRAYEEKNL
jgi:hypothetical protein